MVKIVKVEQYIASEDSVDLLKGSQTDMPDELILFLSDNQTINILTDTNFNFCKINSLNRQIKGCKYIGLAVNNKPIEFPVRQGHELESIISEIPCDSISILYKSKDDKKAYVIKLSETGNVSFYSRRLPK